MPTTWMTENRGCSGGEVFPDPVRAFSEILHSLEIIDFAEKYTKVKSNDWKTPVSERSTAQTALFLE